MRVFQGGQCRNYLAQVKFPDITILVTGTVKWTNQALDIRFPIQLIIVIKNLHLAHPYPATAVNKLYSGIKICISDCSIDEVSHLNNRKVLFAHEGWVY